MAIQMEKTMTIDEAKFNSHVKLSELADEDELVNISIEAFDDDSGDPVALSALDPESLECYHSCFVDPESLEECDDSFEGRTYSLIYAAKKANPTPEEIADPALNFVTVVVEVSEFGTKYTPDMVEGVTSFIGDLIRNLSKPRLARNAGR